MAERTESAENRSDWVGGQWLCLLATGLLVLASGWSSATTCARIVLLWVVAVGVLGSWGQRSLGDTHRAFLAALLGVGLVHLVVFPASGQPLAVVAAKTAVLLLALSGLVVRSVGSVRPADISGSAEPGSAGGEAHAVQLAGRNRYVTLAIVLSAAMAIYYARRLLAGQSVAHAAVVPAILAPPAYVLIFAKLVCDYRNAKRRGFVARLLLVAPVAATILAAMQLTALGIAERRAGRLFEEGETASALQWNATSLAVNGRLRIRATDDRLLLQRAQILEALGRPTEALGAMFRRIRNRFWRPDEPRLRSLCDDYLTTASLDEQIVELSHPNFVWRFDRLPLPDDPTERSLLLGLFVRSELLDRLLIEYAQNGLAESLDFDYLRRSLESRERRGDKDADTWTDFFIGVCDAQLGQGELAHERLRGVLARWPRYHNALVWLERLDKAPAGPGPLRRSAGILPASTSNQQPATDNVPQPGRIGNEHMLGNRRWELNVDDALWTGLEVRRGRYRLGFEVKGLPAEGEWPTLSVSLDGSLILEQPVKARDWITVEHELAFDRDGCHNLVVGFPNDLHKEIGDKIINRNLYLRQIVVRGLPASD